jgi:hypothetical protein
MYLERRNHATKHKKPLLFKSFTGLTIKEFDDIYDKQIVKRYEKYKDTTVIQKKRRWKKKSWCWKAF